MSGSAAVGNYTPVRASRFPESRMVAEFADLAVIPGAGLAPQELPYIEGLVDDGNWAGSRLSRRDKQAFNIRARASLGC